MWDIESTTALLRRMSETSDPQALLRLLLAHARRGFNVDRAIVLSREGLEHPLFRVVLAATCDDPRDEALANHQSLIRSGGLLAELLYAGEFRRVMPIAYGNSEPSLDLLEGSRSLVAFPLHELGEALGMVVLLGPTGRDCGAPDLCGLAIMAALLQRADRAHVLAQRLETTCRALDAELSAAASVQRWLLPPAAPPAPNVDIASLYRTACHCGGDYYDAGTLAGGAFGVLIADVSGHGAAAAVLMAILRTVVHDEVDRTCLTSPAALLDRADERFCTLGLPGRGAFITAFSGALDSRTGRFTYSCAGHPPPRLLRAADRAVAPIEGATLPPLGVLDDGSPHQEQAIGLQPGDLILFYSDGITEARSPAGEFFGMERLDQVLADLSQPASSAAAVEAIRDAVDAFSRTAPPADDQTLLAVRWRG